MARVHMLMQGKGGVGKSLIATLLAQYKISKAARPLCIDTDPVNATFASFEALQVRRLTIMDGEEIDPRSFDGLIEWIAQAKEDVIVDSGASAFVPLAHYMISNQAAEVLTELGHELVIHSVIAGGQALLDTVSGFAQLVRQFPEGTAFVVWLNPYSGPVAHEGKPFEQMKAYTAAKDRIAAILTLPTLKPETYGRDLREMLQARLTFDEALARDTLPIMARQRLKIVRDQVFAQMELASSIL